MRRAYSDRQRARLLDWIDEIKLSEKSGSKIRDHLTLDDHNLINARNSKLPPKQADLNQKIEWTTLQSRIKWQQEQESKEIPTWVDELFLSRDEFSNPNPAEGANLESPVEQPQHPMTIPTPESRAIAEETQRWMDGHDHLDGPEDTCAGCSTVWSNDNWSSTIWSSTIWSTTIWSTYHSVYCTIWSTNICSR